MHNTVAAESTSKWHLCQIKARRTISIQTALLVRLVQAYAKFQLEHVGRIFRTPVCDSSGATLEVWTSFSDSGSFFFLLPVQQISG
jgi:hypothetical protein